MTRTKAGYKEIEIWRQDTQNQDLWHGENGVMLNTAALKERQPYFDIVKIPTAEFIPDQALLSGTPNL